MSDVLAGKDLSALDESELMALERQIARRYLGKIPWFAVIWAFGNFAIWVSLFPLVMLGILPLWAGFIIATINITLCYLPSHEAQHDIIARPGEKLRWLNELTGHVSLIPLGLPFRVARLTHMEHHKHTNHPELDPDISTKAPNAWAAVWKSIKERQPNGKGSSSYGETLARLGGPEAAKAGRDAAIHQVGFLAVLFTMAWTGFALEAALLWWLPRHIAQTYIFFYLSWAPHHPGEEIGRYRDTRGWRSKIGNILSLGMQYHIIHHLHPRIPLMKTGAAYWEMRAILEARGCELENL